MADFVRLLLDSNDKNFQGPMNYSPIPRQQESLYAPIPDEYFKKEEPVVPIMQPVSTSVAPAVPTSAPQNAPQVNELNNAMKELQEAQELDKQSGSEGYEAKQNGIYSRMKDWGNLASLITSYDNGSLFQSALSSGDLRNSIINYLSYASEKDINDLIEKYGGDNKSALKRLASIGLATRPFMGGQGMMELFNFGKDWKERGIGAVTGRANDLLTTMANSPYSKFVDPTTVLGGQRTMVNNIDKYFDNRGIDALRKENLAMQMARLKTPIGQAEEWAKKTPEQQAAMKPYFEMKGTGGYTGVGAKNPLQAAQRQVVGLVNDGVPMQEALQQVSDDTGIPANEILYGAPARQKPAGSVADFGKRKVLDYIQEGLDAPDAVDRYRNEYGDYETPSDVLLGGRTAGTYAPHTPEEKINVAQREGFAKAYSTRVGKKLDEVEAPDYDNTLRDLVGFYEYLSDPRNKDIVGGPLNTTIKQFASSLGVSDKDQDAFLASFLQSQRAMHAVAIRQINQSGATNAEEQRNAARSIIDINKGYDYNKKMVEQTISNMALAQAMTKDEYYLAEGGGSKKDNDALLRRKYGAMIHDPNKFIDPRLVDLHLGEDGEYAYSPSIGGFVFGREE